MPLFKRIDGKLVLLKASNFKTEKDLQSLLEKNLETVFNCRFVATEFSTGAEHSGRIDTLALSEENNPVIIEYKKVESSELINQSLFYLAWINDHRGDFQVVVERKFGKSVKIDWDEIRVICIAPAYRKHDLHAVSVMGANIELWQYRLFEDGSLFFDEVFRKSTALYSGLSSSVESKNPVMVAAGKKGAITRANGSYTFEQHVEGVDEKIKKIVQDLRDYILSLDESVEESPKKCYIAYKIAQNFACIEVQNKKVILFLKLDPRKFKLLPVNARDVSSIGHYGTGVFEYTVKVTADLVEAKKLIKQSFDEVGG